MSESKKGFPQKKKASDFIIYAVIAIVLAAVGVWGGYVLQETANMKGEVNFQKALDRSGDYMNLNSFLFAIISALTDNGIAKKAECMEEWQDFSFLLISYPKPRSVFTEKVRNTVRHDGELIKKNL